MVTRKEFLKAILLAAAAGSTTLVQAQTASKTLVIYYSWSGNTRAMAEAIAKELKADIYEIRPITPYPEAYNATVDLAREQLRQNARPAIQKDVPDLSQYSTILLGTPNWWSHVAMPVFTFMDQNDLSGKVVLPFVSHGGGGMSGCEHDIRNKYPKADVPKQLPSKEGRFLLTKHELFHPLPLRISSQWGYR